MNIAVGIFGNLIINKLSYAIAQLDHSLYSIGCRFRQIVFKEHSAVFAEIDVTVNDCIREVLYTHIGGYALYLLFVVLALYLDFGYLPLNIRYRRP